VREKSPAACCGSSATTSDPLPRSPTTTAASTASGATVPRGEARFGGTLPTTYRYTGQRQEDLLGGADGLYYYGVRWYDAALGRWLSPDSIIPEAAQGVQAWSRYTYVNNAPTRYQDPTGHWINFAAGNVVGAAIGMGSYLLDSALSGSFSCRDLALSTGTGAAGAAYNLTAGENYNSTDMLIAAGVGAAAGAANSALGMTSLAGTSAGWATELGINGVAGGVQHLATQLNHGATLNTSLLTESAVVGGLSASVTGLVNEVLSPQLPSLASNINKLAGAGSSPHLSRRTLNYLTRAYVTRDFINGLTRGETAEIFSRYTTVSAE
jgi:RHS repeat-associated protein